MKDLEFMKRKSVIKEAKIKIEVLPYVAPYSEYGWIHRKFMDLTSRASKNSVYHKLRKDEGFYYIEKMTVIE